MGRKEILLIFFLFLIGAGVIFAMGIKVGEYLFENECPTILEESIKKSSVQEKATQETVTTDDTASAEQIKTDIPTETPKIEQTKSESEPKINENEKKAKGKVDKAEKTDKAPSNMSIKEITQEIKGKYTIQISSYQDELEAQQVAYKLYSSGFKLAYYMEAEIPNKGIWYRVGIGFFKKRESARIFAEMLKKQNKIDSYIIRIVD
ncbi:MAG: SPOR domain-containing protein [bacterium]